ncbi:hypothetical protein [Hansschlegelia zhihuaiae]|uniref:Secreted protein n=1 Tax=Hansschlegelia zhihuaiae TaxID=405005 RepID=A0A4Q0MKJ4_9HYPH|nr:hypothetical protein [Hansschlegelia zhihuaiae]RXF74287.1 hypothetical protein EK403_05515 [Hansschlegelia zhihuaiae]
MRDNPILERSGQGPPMLSRGLFASFVMTSAVFAATSAAAQSPGPELIYTPITPCRAFDTEAPGAGGRIRANKTRNFQITGTTGFDTQGGQANGCGVPASAAAVALQLTAVHPAADGHFTAFAAGAAKPDAESMVYLESTSVSSGVTAPLGAGRLGLFSRKAAGAKGTITGYYAPQLVAHIGAEGQILAGTSRVLNAERILLGGYRITFDRDVRNCIPILTVDGVDTTAFIDTSVEFPRGWAQIGVRMLAYTEFGRNYDNAPFRLVVHC